MTPEEKVDFILGKPVTEIDKHFVDTYCSMHYDNKTKKIVPPQISFQDECILKKGKYVNKDDVRTNIGQLVMNRMLFERTPSIQAVVGYVAQPFDRKTIDDFEDKIAKAAVDGRITPDDFATYLNCIQWAGNTLNTNVSCSFTPNTIKVLPAVKKRRDELYAKHKEEIDAGNVTVAVQISDELLDLAKQELKDDPGMLIYTSGAKPKFGNNYKNCFVTRGPSFNPAQDRFDISKNAFMDGMDKSDIPSYGTSVINGAYSKAIGTGVAGYETKKYFASYQHLVLDEHGSDCGSKGFRLVKITKDNKSKLLYRYIIEGSKLVLLTIDNISNYAGKFVKMRSPLYCVGDKICNKCMGELFYRLGIKNVGLTASSIGSNYLNLLMKAFHDSSIKLSDVDIEDMIIE